MLKNSPKELELKDEIRIKENKIIYNSDTDVILWQGQTTVLRMYTPLKKLNISSRFGVVLEEDLLDSNVFLIQNLFCYTHDEFLVLRLYTLDYNNLPVKLQKDSYVGTIFSFD